MLSLDGLAPAFAGAYLARPYVVDILMRQPIGHVQLVICQCTMSDHQCTLLILQLTMFTVEHLGRFSQNPKNRHAKEWHVGPKIAIISHKESHTMNQASKGHERLTVSHKESTIKAFAEDPELLSIYLESVAEDGDADEMRFALRYAAAAAAQICKSKQQIATD